MEYLNNKKLAFGISKKLSTNLTESLQRSSLHKGSETIIIQNAMSSVWPSLLTDWGFFKFQKDFYCFAFMVFLSNKLYVEGLQIINQSITCLGIKLNKEWKENNTLQIKICRMK